MTSVAGQSSHEQFGTLASAAPRRRRRAGARRFKPKEAGRSFLFTFIVVVVLAAFLSPLVRSVFVSLKTPEQVGQIDAPPYPAVHATFDYQGKTYDVYDVPIDGADEVARPRHEGPRVEQVRRSGERGGRPDHLAGIVARPRARRGRSRPNGTNYSTVWNQIDFPRLLFNTVGDRADRDDRHAPLVHARGLRIRPVPVPRPRASCSRS